MRHIGIGIGGCLASLLTLLGTSGLAVAAETCPSTPFTVTAVSDPSAADVAANGLNDPSCVLTIAADLPNPATSLTITAKSVAIAGASIISANANSTIRITAKNGNIVLNNAVVKATKTLNFKCDAPADCKFESSNQSQIIAATQFGPPPTGNSGVLIIDVNGDVNISETQVHGQVEWKILSDNGNITIRPCGTTANGCEDPNLSLPAIVTSQCGNPIVFPCTVTVDNPAELKSICFPAPVAVPCNGGVKEKRFEAKKGFIDVTGVTLTSFEHMTFWCGPGGFKGANSNLSSKTAEILINCTFNGGGPVDLTNAVISAPNGIDVKGGGGVNPEITACGATFTILSNNKFPALEGGTRPSFANPLPSGTNYSETLVKYLAAQTCTPGATFCNLEPDPVTNLLPDTCDADGDPSTSGDVPCRCQP